MENDFAQELMKKIEETYTGYGFPVSRVRREEGEADALQIMFVLPENKEDTGEDDSVKSPGLPLMMEVMPHSLEDAEIMQYYVYIHIGVSPEEWGKLRPILDMDSMLRTYGHYGVFPTGEDGSGMLYYRQEAMMLHEDGIEHAVKQFGNVLDYIFVMLSDSVYGLLEEIGKLPENPKDTEDFIFCTNCGKKLSAGSKFCTGCGAKI